MTFQINLWLDVEVWKANKSKSGRLLTQSTPVHCIVHRPSIVEVQNYALEMHSIMHNLQSLILRNEYSWSLDTTLHIQSSRICKCTTFLHVISQSLVSWWWPSMTIRYCWRRSTGPQSADLPVIMGDSPQILPSQLDIYAFFPFKFTLLMQKVLY